MNSSFEEKSVWIQLTSMVLVLTGYFVIAGRMMAEGVHELPPYAFVFAVAVVLQVVVLVAGYTGVAIVSRPDGRDERDRLISWKAESRSSWILGVGVLTAITGMILDVGNVWVAHFLLLSLFLSQVLCFVCQLVYYRRGV